MTIEMLAVLFVMLIAVILFTTEKVPVDITAILVMTVLMAFKIVTPEEGVTGFGSSATITVAAMFVISAAIKKTGAINFIGTLLSKIFKFNFWVGLFAAMIIVLLISAFVNNTPVIAVFIPLVLSVAAENNFNPAKMLMPVSFASIFGGASTLIGTSTNIIVSSIAVQHGLSPFGMFEFTSLGVILAGAGILYMFFAGVKMIPSRIGNRNLGDLGRKYNLDNYMTDIILLPGAKSIGQRLIDSDLLQELEINVLNVRRNGEKLLRPLSSIILQENDVLRVNCNVSQLMKIKDRAGVMLKSEHKFQDDGLGDEDIMLVEAVISPNSFMVGKSIKSAWFRNVYHANAIAIRHRGQLLHDGLVNIILESGDAILLYVSKEHYRELNRNEDFVIVSELDRPVYNKTKIIPALAIVVFVIVAATFSLFSIMVCAIIGCMLLIAAKCITVEDAYDSVDWRIIFLLGSMQALGIALDKTGTASYISKDIILILGKFGPVAILSAIFLFTSLLTGVMSNNATAILLTPIAIFTAQTMGVSPKPFLMAVAFAASSSFMTPIGYQTNTMIYGVGQYKFFDFVRVGGPLNIIFWILATIFIPILFPF